MSEKIKPQHLARKAILYVRQSTAYQVENTSRARSCSTRWKRICALSDGAASRSSMRTSGASAGGTVTRTVLRSSLPWEHETRAGRNASIFSNLRRGPTIGPPDGPATPARC